MNKKIINFVFTILLIKVFVTSGSGIGFALFLLFFCADWFIVLWLTDKLNYERKQDETLQGKHRVFHKHGFLDIGHIHRSDLDAD